MSSQSDVQKQINDFKTNFPVLKEERNNINEKLAELLRDRLLEIQPIVDFLKQQTTPVYHTLSEKFQGVVLGEYDNYDFIFTGSNNYLPGGILALTAKCKFRNRTDQTHTLESFADYCDVEFALKEIEVIKTCLESYLSDYKKKSAEKLKLAEKLCC